MPIYAVANQKGGVGKTATVLSLGAAIQDLEKSVLLVDFDPQASLTSCAGFNPDEAEATVYNALAKKQGDLSAAVFKTEFGCDLIPANIDLAMAEIELVGRTGRERILKGKLDPIAEGYDVTLIDCPPSLGLLTLNALVAADQVIIPCAAQFLALRGLSALWSTIEDVKENVADCDTLTVLGVLATMTDSRTNHSNEAVEQLRKQYGRLVFKAEIPRTVRMADAATSGKPIIQFAPTSPAALAYEDLAKEVLSRGKAHAN